MALSAGTKIGVVLALGTAVVAAGAVFYWLKTSESPVKDIADSKLGEIAKKALVPEEQRREYIKKHVTIENLSIDPDTKPGDDGGPSDEVVPGLLRVSGVVVNGGDKQIGKITLIVHPLDDTNDVLGTYMEPIVNGPPLEPGERRPFKFQIPEKKAFSGRFLHDLR